MLIDRERFEKVVHSHQKSFHHFTEDNERLILDIVENCLVDIKPLAEIKEMIKVLEHKEQPIECIKLAGLLKWVLCKNDSWDNIFTWSKKRRV